MQARPRYERELDRERERAVVETVFHPYGMRTWKLPASYEVDFGLTREGEDALLAVAEVKVRGRAYDTLLLSMHKAQALRRFAAEGFRAYLLVALPAGIYVKRVQPDERFEVRMGGRRDRGDWQDIEPCAHFPMLGMRKVAEPGAL